MGRGRRTIAVAIAGLALGMRPPSGAAQEVANWCFGERATIVGSAADDVIEGTRERDVIVGAGGLDTILGRAGADLLCGGDHADRLFGGDGRDQLTGDRGPARLAGGGGDDRLVDPDGEFPRSFSVWMIGGRGDDRLEGRYPANYFFPGPGDDHIDGGGSELSNELRFDQADAAVEVDAQRGQATGEGTDRFTGIHIVVGSRFDDVIVGSADVTSLAGIDGDDVLVSGGEGALPPHEPDLMWMAGGTGNDNLLGAASVDFMSGDSGKDIVRSRGGDDWITAASGSVGNDRGDSDMVRGGPGLDHVVYDINGRARFALWIDLAQGFARDIDGVLFRDVLEAVEGVTGTNYDDVFLGNSADNVFWGLDGSDVVLGREGNDRLHGYGDSDRLDGGMGIDELKGGLGEGRDECARGEIVSECEETWP